MEFMLLIIDKKGVPVGAPVGMEAMRKYAVDLAGQGKIRGGAPLRPEVEGARVQVRDGKAMVTDGPFAETREAIAGSFVIDAASHTEAIEIAKRCPYAQAGIVEVRLMPDRDVAKRGQGTQFLLLLHSEPGECDPDGSKYREMVAYDNVLKGEGTYVESSQLASDPPAARIEGRDGKTFVTDGPFAETKEVAGGYYVVEAANRAEAIGIATRCPHARWGSIEVRELIPVGPR